MDADLLNLRAAIDGACWRDEAAAVAELLAGFDADRYDRDAAAGLARRLVEAVRRRRGSRGGVEELMQEFSLSSREGVALMCLAEALLRIPDKATADRLIRDKLAHGDWRAHLGGSPSLFVNAATWGLMIGGRLVATHGHGELGQALSSLLARGGEPLVRKGMDFAMRLLGEQFVLGENIDAALARAAKNAARGYRHSFDMLGEAALTAADAERYCAAYAAAIDAIGGAAKGRGPVAGPGISIKLSALHPRYLPSQRERVTAELLPRLKSLMLLARSYDIGVNIDAEESERLALSLDLLEALAADPDLAGWDGLGFVVQAYQKRAPPVVAHLVALARHTGRRLMVRLVKGAYWDTEIKHAQVDGLDYPVWTRKAHTDLCYLACAARLLDAPDAVYPQFATHNAATVATVFEMARARGAADYEFQCLHGMGEPLYDHVVGDAGIGRACRIYAPVGTHETLLPYLVRRLLENGANSSFVNRIADPAVPVDALLADPAREARRDGGAPHPAIPRPAELYGAARRNSRGIDLASDADIARLEQAFAALDGTGIGSPSADAAPADVEAALAAAHAGAAAWHARGAAERAAILLRAADLFEDEGLRLMHACIREAGKTWPSAVAEVREAADYCRYYAQQVRAGRCAHEPPGVFACISPWNFPLAIFVGQVAAALAVGAAVVAKPAEQTPRVAALAVDLLRRAGVPDAALQLLPGRGETVGAALVADRRVHGVLFTGSTDVAQAINRKLADRAEGAREACLVAETGGQNAMIVDSSALPEQVVQDVLASAFDSAGQRCSALRVLCLQEEIAERVLGMLRAAMAELRVGDPMLLATDVGPVINAEARDRLVAHVERMRAEGHVVYQTPLPAACVRGCYVAPTLIEIGALAELEGEVFGPVLHVLRFAGEGLDALLADINATGYGLTLGVHSRIDETVARVVAGARVGNLYVNRNMIGAVVGVQPFGGEGLSGTGPKAGGPLLLPRLGGAGHLHPADFGGRRIAAALPPPLRLLSAWAQAGEHLRLAQACADYAATTLLDVEVELPGPTGERNTLRFAPRGDFLCLAAGEEDLREQLAAVVASGNRPVFEATPLHERVAAGLPEALALGGIAWRTGRDFRGLAGVLFVGAAAELARVRRLAAAIDGPLLPVLTPGRDGRYPLYRMLVERVVSINTAAAGGNTTLMTLGA